MNKSKFLKRSLAAILAILMVVAMVPSALAAQVVNESVPTARVFNDPGYLISVDGERSVWDANSGAYTASTSYKEGNPAPTSFKVSMSEVNNLSVTVKGIDDSKLGATVKTLAADKAEKTVDGGVTTYTYTLVAVTTNDDGDILSTDEYKLAIAVTMQAKSSDATIKAFKYAKVSGVVSMKFNDTKTGIDIVLALGADVPTITTNPAPADVFIPNESHATVQYDKANKKVVVTAENGDTNTYPISFTYEPAFDSFKLGDFEGKIDTTFDSTGKTIIIDLPYKYLNDAGNDIVTDELADMVATWTVSTGSKVYFSTDEKESGEEKLTFGAADTSTAGLVGSPQKYVAKAVSTAVKVQTKKSGEAKAITIYLRVPIENPDAELTGIQIIKGSGDVTDEGNNYTQYLPIKTGERTITVDLPYGVKKADGGLFIHVWGAKNSTIELDEGRETNEANPENANAFNNDDDSNDGKKLDGVTEISSDTAINVTKSIVLKVVSEDGKTTLKYNLAVNEYSGGSATLDPIKLVDGDGKEVGKVTKDTTGKNIDITLPYKYGNDAAALKALELVATAPKSAKIGFAAVSEIASAGTREIPATPAVYYQVHTALTANDTDDDGSGNKTAANMTVGGVTVKIGDVTDESLDTAAEQVAAFIEGATSADWTISVDDENSAKIIFTAKNAGELNTNVEDPAPPTAAPAGMTKDTDGSNATTEDVPATTIIPFVNTHTVEDLVDPDRSDATAFDITLGHGETAGTNNVFTLRVSNGTSNGTNDYKITLKKADASNEAKIESVKVTDSSTRDDMTEYNAKVSTRDAKDKSTIVVDQLPYSLDAEEDFYFSELKVSPEAKVVIKVGSTPTLMAVTEGNTPANSTGFKVGADTTRWDKTNKEVELWVYSEAAWAGLTGADDDAKLATCTNSDDATKVYKMSASYAEAATGKTLESITSPLDENVKITKSSNTYTVTVPASYVTKGTKFTLDIKTSPFASIHAATISGSTVTPKGDAITSDEGDADKKASATQFVVENNGGTYELKYYIASAKQAAFNGIVVRAQAGGDNTTVTNINVAVAPVETSNAIESITVDGQKAVAGADGETWTLTLPYGTTDMVKLVDIKTVSKLAAVTVDEAEYKPEDYYDLGADLVIKVTAENGEAFTYTLKTVVSTEQPPVVDPSDSYKDIPSGGMGDWVKKAINAGIMGDTGTDADGKLIFAPQETTQRRWFALMVARADIMADNETITDKEAADKKLLADYGDKEPNFTDTANEADTAKAAIAYCQEKGIMNGDAGKFNPAGIVNRMEAASMLKNWLKLTEGGKENTHDFKDWDKIPNWAKGNINAVADDKIMNGHDDGTFGTENLTRVQTAVIMVQAYDRLKESK